MKNVSGAHLRCLKRLSASKRREDHVPAGSVVWRAECDKLSYLELTPISPSRSLRSPSSTLGLVRKSVALAASLWAPPRGRQPHVATAATIVRIRCLAAAVPSLCLARRVAGR